MNSERPDPDQLIEQLKKDGLNRKRGRLKIFFGYASGVGKTYAMLENARRAIQAGDEVVLGYLEPHARPATMKLAEAIEAIEPREIQHRGVLLKEFDVDSALQRRPRILLVDELAHRNVEGSRHQKRWQDIEEILDAGVDVWTTLNVQHIESLNDIVGQITGVVVRETIPDRVFELADEIELVDLPPDELLDRLRNGHVYLPENAQRALASFFKRSNLDALREMSLRQAASRVHSDVEFARSSLAVSKPWATADRLLVCVGPSPSTSRVIRTAKRMASALDAKWIAISVDLPGRTSDQRAQDQIAKHFRLAEALGAETLTLAGNSVEETILEYARKRNVTKILIGKTSEPSWKRWFARSIVDRLIEVSHGIDVYVIQGEQESSHEVRSTVSIRSMDWYGHATAILVTGLSALLSYSLRFMDLANTEANRVMIFLAGVACVAFRFGVGPSITACILSVMVFDFFFVPPFGTFAVSDAQYIVTFAVMMAIGLLVSALASRLRWQIDNSRKREQHSNALYELGRELSSLYGEMFLVAAATSTLGELLEGQAAVYLRNAAGETYPVQETAEALINHPVSLPTADWVIEHAQMAGLGTDTLPNACALFLPLQGSQRCLGALAFQPTGDIQHLLTPENRRILESGTHQLALALERDRLAIDAAEARLKVESEQLRSTLLSSVSHDLKTPLAGIAGASSSLLSSERLDSQSQRELIESIATESMRLNRLLDKILQMSRLDVGATNPNMQWHVLEEIVGSALKHTAEITQHHSISVDMAEDFPLIWADDVLLEQVLVNLLENASKYTAAGTKVTVSAIVQGSKVVIGIRDNGPGIPIGLEEKIFEKFHRADPKPDSGKGNGLGLAICRAIVKLHGGTIRASNCRGGGALFEIQLPLSKIVPNMDVG